MGKLEGKVALITGAASGIGRETAVLFAGEGARIVVADYQPEGGRQTARMIEDAGGRAEFVQTDVRQSAEVQNAIRHTVDAFGQLDILHNNAGVMTVCLLGEVSEEEWDNVLDTNLKGAFLGTRYALPVMLKQGGGVIINTASIMGFNAQANVSPYCVSKAAIIMLTKATSAEYSKLGIRANCICPGFIKTPMTQPWEAAVDIEKSPPGKYGLPEDIASAALYLASDEARYVTGSALVVDGGYAAEWMVPLKM
ncbi:MAG: SDR family NAD(P)-dependent oxidoreductase [Dehalococcoidia bacterium]